MEKYAVLETGGKQTLVKVGQRIEIEKIAVEAGKDAELTTVLEHCVFFHFLFSLVLRFPCGGKPSTKS